MHLIFHALFVLALLWTICALGRAILSWFPLEYDSGWSKLNAVLVRVTEPLIKPVRRLLGPVQFGGVGLDLAFIIVFIAMEFLAFRVLLPLS